MNKIFIIAGGYSLTEFPKFKSLKQYGTVLAIKDAALYMNCDFAINMDRQWFKHRYQSLINKNIKTYTYIGNLKGGLNHLKDNPLFTFFESDYNNSTTLSDDPNILNGDHSGMIALNLAYQLKPKEIFLLGYDMGKTGNNSYWYPFYEYNQRQNIKDQKYKEWGREFDKAAKQCYTTGIKLWNVNPKNTIDCIRQITFKEFEDYIK